MRKERTNYTNQQLDNLVHTTHFVKVMSLDTFMTFFPWKNIPSHSRKRTFVLVGHMSLFPKKMYVPYWVEFSSQLLILT